MGRYIGPACKLCRREGMKLFLKGTRCYMAKCAIERGRPAPGQHGMKRARKTSDYGVQLREKQRLRRQFGMQEGQFRLFFMRAARRHGITGEKLLQDLELQLGNVVYRAGFANSRRAARQLVMHGHVRVGGRRAYSSSMVLEPGDKLVIKEKTSSHDLAARNVESSDNRSVPAWLACDPKALTCEVLHIPSRDEIAPTVNEQLIVELYSK